VCSLKLTQIVLHYQLHKVCAKKFYYINAVRTNAQISFYKFPDFPEETIIKLHKLFPRFAGTHLPMWFSVTGYGTEWRWNIINK